MEGILIVELTDGLSEAEIEQLIEEIYVMRGVFSVREAARQPLAGDAGDVLKGDVLDGLPKSKP